MRKMLRRIGQVILGLDDTELAVNQMNYIKDVTENRRVNKISEENMTLFIESLKEKHNLNHISLFRKGIAIFSSEREDLEKTVQLHEMYMSNKKLMKDKMILMKDKTWVTLYEKDEFIFIVKRDSKVNEFEMSAITSDVLKNLDSVLMEERNLIESIYNMNR